MQKYYIYNNKEFNEFLTIILSDTLPNILLSYTTIECPSIEIGYTRCFDSNTNTWSEQIEDNRNKIVYNINDSTITKVISELGPIPLGFTTVKPTDKVSKKFDTTKNEWYLEAGLTLVNYSDIKNKPFIPKKISDLTNDLGFITINDIPQQSFTLTDPIYIADKPTLALKSELFSKSYNDLTDKPTNIQELGITITTDDIISNYFGNGDNLTTELTNILESMWTSVQQLLENYVKTVNEFSPDENGNVSLSLTTDDIISNYTNNGQSLTYELEQLENNMWDNFMYLLNNNRNYVTTVNGLLPDENGNVSLDGLVIYSINQQIYPDENGNVNGIITIINDILADIDGKITIDASNIPFKTELDGTIIYTNEYVLDIKNKIDTFVAHKVAVCGKNYLYMLSDIYQKNNVSSVFTTIYAFNNVKQVSLTKSAGEDSISYNLAGKAGFILSDDGNLYIAGIGHGYMFGNGTNTNQIIYKHSSINQQLKTKFKQISIGSCIVGALDTDNKLYMWSLSYNGGTFLPGKYFSLFTWKSIDCGPSYIGGIDLNNKLYLWGTNRGGQIGNGTYGWLFYDLPQLIDETKKWKKLILPQGAVTSVENDYSTTHAIDINGHLYGWGANHFGLLGNGTTTYWDYSTLQLSPLLIDDTHEWVLGSAGYGFIILIDSNGHLYGCGQNNYGQLGLGNTSAINILTLIDDTHIWKSVHCGTTHALVIDSNGHLYGCGQNNYGQLGLGDTTNRNTLTLIDDTKKYVSASCSYGNSMVIYELIILKTNVITLQALSEHNEIAIGDIVMKTNKNNDIIGGYLLCNGGQVSRTTYHQLFDVIGTTYGSGNGTSTFNLPNLVNKVIIGGNNSGTSSTVSTGGSSTLNTITMKFYIKYE